jgi:hypothetical protein
MSGNRRRRTEIAGQWTAHRIDMLRSPAWRALTLSARRILDRIEIEHASHGGAENGRLPVTYEQFHQYGIHRHAIGPAIREVVALGFVEITEAGRAGNAEFRCPNYFRLTYLNTKTGPTNEWEKITEKDAEAIARAARKASAPVPEKAKSQCRKTTVFDDENRHRKGQIHTPETITTAPPPETVTTSISGEGDGGDTKARETVPPLACSRSAPHGAAASEHAKRTPTDLNGHSKPTVTTQLAEILRARGWVMPEEIASRKPRR